MADDNVLARLQERIRLEGVAWLAPLVSSVSLPADPTVPQSTRPQRTARAPARLSPSPPAGGRRSTGKKAAKSRKAPLQGPPEQGHRRVSMAVRASAARGARLAQSEGTAAAAASGQCVSASPLDSGITAAAASSHSTSAPSACPPVPSVLPTAVGIPPPAPSPPPPPPGRLARWFGRVPKPSSAPVPPVPCTAAPPAGSPAGTAGQDSSSSEFFDVEPYSPPDEALSIRASTASVSRSQSRERRHSRRDRHATRSSSSSSSAESYKSAGRKRRRRTSHASGSHRPRSACREHEESRRHKRRYRRSPRHRRYSPSSVSSSGESRVRHSSHRRVRSRGSSRRSSRESRLERSSHTGSMLAPPTSSAPQPSVSNPGSAPLRVSEVESFQGAASSGTTGRSAMPSFSLGAGEHLRPLLESSLSDATWSSHGQRRPAVWLIGHSFIHRAAQRASCRPGGLSLGFSQADVSWRGVGGLRWLRVLSEVIAISKQVHGPAVLVIHAGGNDLCSVRLAELISVIRSDLIRMSDFFSDSIIVWSEIVPRVVWNGARNPGAIERARRILNTRISRFVRTRGGIAIRHRQLEGDNRRLMLQDGVHLNDIGLDIFLSGLQDAIERALFTLVSGGRCAV
ncbi:serine/arginine repetitive matrix protein 1-like isoform X2 [Dendropsophus ebraccatus]|uniref:serine/arginine repetitive matrix protein 1-like isoform X2 n=1 Tax=Dendropsophus ebraccatus TaxID=150705 RepID=UPI0038316318